MASFELPVSKNIWDFDPTSISGCTLWLDGADPNTIFSNTAGTTPATNGGSVARWNDKSGLNLKAILNNNISSYNTIYGTTPPTRDNNFIKFGIGTITATATSSSTNRVTVASSFTISAGQHVSVMDTIGGLSNSARYHVFNPTGTPTTSFQLVTNPLSTSPVVLTDSSSQNIMVLLSSGSLILPYGSLSVNGTGTTFAVQSATPQNAMSISNGQTVNFTSIGTIGGINTSTTYFVVNVDSNSPTQTFSVSLTLGGTAVSLTTGTGASANIGRGSFLNSQQDCTMFAVARSFHNTESLNSGVFSYGQYIPYAGRGIIMRGESGSQISNATLPIDTTSTAGISNSLNLVSGTFNNSIQSGWLNGSPFNNINLFDLQRNGGNWQTGTVVASVGSFLQVYPMYGYIAEVLYYNAALSNTDRQTIEGYLAWKWGIQSSLPTIHPYFNQIRPFLRNFAPTDISNCIMWYDGADLTSMFQDTAGTTRITGTGQSVRLWVDKSGMGNNLTSISLSNSPTLTTSSNPQSFDLVFDGVNDYLSNTAIVNNSNTYTKFLVFNRNSTTAAGYQRTFSYGTTTGEQQWNDQTGFHIQANNSQTQYFLYKMLSASSFTISTNTYYIATIVSNPLNMSLYLNGSTTASAIVSLTTTGTSTNFSGKTFHLGGPFSAATHFWPGVINEVISYNRQLSVTEYREVEGYLGWKWGIRNSLPTAHPFYRFPTPSLTPFQPELQLYKPEFDPSDVSADIWFDPQDRSTIALDSNGRVTQWRNKGTSTVCSFLAIPSYASQSLNTTETLSSGIGLNGPLLTQCVTGSNGYTDYMDFSAGSFYVSSASISGTTMTLTLGNTPVPLTVTGGSISAFSLTTTSGINTTTLATLYFSEQMIPPFVVGSTINLTGSVSSGTALNGNQTVTECTPFYVRFALSGATAGTLSTQGTLTSITSPNVATVNYTSTSARQPIMAGQTIATISGVTPAGLNGTTPTILSATPTQIRFLTSVATGTISSAGTMTSAIIPHNIPVNRQITVGFAPNSRYSDNSTLTDTYFSIETMNSLAAAFTGRGTAYIVASVPAVNTLTITVPAGLPAGSLRLTGGRVDYGEILGSTASTVGGVNNANSLSSTGNTSTSATVNFTAVSRLYTNTFIAGDTITISGVTNPTTYNGSWFVTSATSTSVTFETSTTLANMVSTSGTISRTQFIMPSGCFGIRSISVSGTTATVSYNNIGLTLNSNNNLGNPFKVGHAIYIAQTFATGVDANIFNGTFIVTSQSSDSGNIGTVQFTTTAANGTTSGTGILCRGAGGSAGISGTFSSLSCTINPTNAVVTFAQQPILPFTVGQQICIAGTVSTGTNINGIQTVTACTSSSVTFNITSGTGSVTTQGTLSGGTLVVTGGTYSSPSLTLNFSPSINSPFPNGTWVTVYGVIPTANNGFWQVTGGTTSSVILNAPTGSGPITNATGTVAFSLQMSVGTMTPHGLSPGDVIVMSAQYSFFTNGSNHIGITPIPYTIIQTPTIYRYTILPRINYYSQITTQGWNTSIGPVYTQEAAQVTQFPISGYCLENTRSQASGGIFNSSNATLMYMGHHYMNSYRMNEQGGFTGVVFATSQGVNNNAGTTGTAFSIVNTYSSAPRYFVNRSTAGTTANYTGIRPLNTDAYYQFSGYMGSDINSFRLVTLLSNLTSSTVNDMTPQTFGYALNGWRYESTFRNLNVNGTQTVFVADQTATVTNATWSGSVATLTIVMNSGISYQTGNSITVQNVNPTGFNGTYTLTGTPTLTRITYALASNPGTYVAGTGRVLLNTSTTLSTNHIRLGSPTVQTSSLGITGTSTMFQVGNFYSQGLGEIIALNRILPVEERQLLEGWVSQKYVSQQYLANNQATTKINTSFSISSVSYTGTGPYTYTVTFPSQTNRFMLASLLTIAGCTGTESALNGTWAVSSNNMTDTTVTFTSVSILTSATNVSSAAVTSGTISGTTTGNTFIHPYRTNPTSISPSLDLTQRYAQGLATWFDAANSSTIGFASGNIVNSWSSAGGNLGMVLTNNVSSSNWSNPTYTTDSSSRPYVRFLRLQYACTTISVDASNGILITSPNIVPAADQGIVFNGTISPLNAFGSYYIKSVTPVSGNNYTITVSTSVGGATSTVTQNANLVISPTINRQSTLKSTVTTFTMAQHFTTQSSNNEYTNIVVFSRDGTGGQYIINYATNGNTRFTIEDSTRRCDYNLNGSAVTTQPITYSSTTLVTNIPYILINYRRSSSSFTRLIGNNTIVNTTVNNSSNLAFNRLIASLRMGSYDQPDSNHANAFSGGIYEHMLFKYALTDQAIYQIEGYLAWKWGLQASLPTTHPYYKIRP